MAYYDRYANFREDGHVKIVPFIKIREEETDLHITYQKSTMRFDNLSYKYYGDPNYAWLIMQANPQLGSSEFFIPDLSTLRIAYPLETALTRYEEGIEQYNNENN